MLTKGEPITLANLELATEQELYDYICTHLITQGEKSSNTTGCKYRMEKADGTVLRCAAGCLFTDEQYESVKEAVSKHHLSEDEHGTFAQKLEGSIWSSLVSQGFVPLAHAALIRELQRVHDSNRMITAFMIDSFSKVAKEFNLQPFSLAAWTESIEANKSSTNN